MYIKIVSTVLGVIFVVIFFYILSLLVSEDDEVYAQKSKTTSFDFIRNKSEAELEHKKRIKPKKPETKPLLTTPDISMVDQKVSKPVLKPANIDMPKINLSNNFKGDLLAGASVGSANMDVIPLVRIAPIYPQKALRMRKEGYVKMRFTIDPDGRVHNVEVIESKPGRFFDDAAKKAIKKWKFKPKVVNGKAVEQVGEQTIRFTLGNTQ